MLFKILRFLFSTHKIIIVSSSFFKHPAKFSPTVFQTSLWLDIGYLVPSANKTYGTKCMDTLIFMIVFPSLLKSK